jgi:hypothetical protein
LVGVQDSLGDLSARGAYFITLFHRMICLRMRSTPTHPGDITQSRFRFRPRCASIPLACPRPIATSKSPGLALLYAIVHNIPASIDRRPSDAGGRSQLRSVEDSLGSIAIQAAYESPVFSGSVHSQRSNRIPSPD